MNNDFCEAEGRTVICGELSEGVREALAGVGFRIVDIPRNESVGYPVGRHADLSVCLIPGAAVIRPGLAGDAVIRGILEKSGREIIIAEREPAGEYPGDCSLCACVCGDYLICREASTDPALLREGVRRGLTVLGVRQGYAACSCLALSDGALVTDDPGIAAAFGAKGWDVLLVEKGYVSLPGYDRPDAPGGFFGGCCGLCGNFAVFAGNLETHPEAGAIREFLKLHGTEEFSAGEGMLFDTGKLIFP